MGTLESFRKAYGALKDSTMVGLAKVNSDFKDLDIAIVKATNHVECPPKERHVRKIFSATSVVRPRADVAYCIHALAKRLAKTKNWIVALKTLIVIHRTLRESDQTFREELLNYSNRGHVLQISNFKDDSSPMAWDCSAWVRTYALFLEERLECFRVLRYDIESERLTKSPAGAAKAYSRTRHLASEDLLEQLPALQQLLYRLIGCLPEGAAFGNYLIQYALSLVLKESFKIYCAINDGIINLVDLFFEMPRHDAVKALNIYKRAGKQAENLADFYEFCKGLDLARHFQFPTLRQPPPSFLATMEEYVKEAPQTGAHSKMHLDHQEPELQEPEPQESEEPPPPETGKQVEVDEKPVVETQEEPQTKIEAEPLPHISTDTTDLLGLSEINPKAAELEKNNALALAIVPSGNDPASAANSGWGDFNGVNASGWELSLVTTPSPNINHAPENKLAGGFNKLLLDSLYEDDAARRKLQQQNAGYGFGICTESSPNPFEVNDPFSMSKSIAPSMNVQMALMTQQQMMLQQQQQQMMLQQQQQQQLQHQQPNYQQQYKQQQDMMSMLPQRYLPQYSQQPIQMQMQNTPPSNPFGDPFSVQPQSARPQQGSYSLL